MSTDYLDRMQQGSSSNCCGATIMTNGLCSDCGEHCEDEPDEEESDNNCSDGNPADYGD